MQSQIKEIKFIKLQNGKKIHAFQKDISYEQLIESIKQGVSKVPEKFSLYYIDQEGDNVTISSNEDLKFMLETQNNKIYLTQEDQEVLSSEKTYQEQQSVLQDNNQLISSVILCNNNKENSQDSTQIIADEEQQKLIPQELPQSQQEYVKDEQPKVEQNQQQEDEKKVEEVQQQQEEQPKLQACPQCTYQNEASFMFCRMCSEALPEVQKPKKEAKKTVVKGKFGVSLKKNAKQMMEQIRNKVASKSPKSKQLKIKKLSKDEKQMKRLLQKEFEKKVPELLQSVKSQLTESQILAEKQEKQEEQSKIYHRHIICDGCEKHGIYGSRYKCAVCEDFDFCENCEATKEHEHPFLKIRDPKQAPKMIVCVLPEQFEQFQKKGNTFLDKIFQNKGGRCPFQRRRKSQEKKQEQNQEQQQQQKDPKHIFENLLVGGSEDFKKASEKIQQTITSFFAPQRKPEQKQEQQQQQQQPQEQKKELSKAEQIAEIFGGKPEDYEQVLAVYPQKDMQEIVRILLAEQEAAKKFSKKEEEAVVEKEQKPQVFVEQKETPKSSEQCQEKKQEEQPQQEKKELKKQYSSVMIEKAKKIAEVLGGEYQDYLGVCDQFLFQSFDSLLDMILEDPNVVTKYSPYK